jgi:hypothetical protein
MAPFSEPASPGQLSGEESTSNEEVRSALETECRIMFKKIVEEKNSITLELIDSDSLTDGVKIQKLF